MATKTNEPTAFKASVSIGRTTSNRESDYISVEVEDQPSGCALLRLKIPLDVFATAVTGRVVRGVEGMFFSACPVGAIYEHKEVEVEIPKRWSRPSNDAQETEASRAILSPLEVDGWRGRDADLWNGHRYVDRPGIARFQRVHFGRYVDATTGQPVVR